MIAIVSDIHGNLVAFEKVLSEILLYDVSEIYFLGDAVNYYPDCNGVIELLKKHQVKCILGNHDNMVIHNKGITESQEKIYNLNSTQGLITSSNLNFMRLWSSSFILEVERKKILLVHGSSTDNLEGYIYPDSDLSEYNQIEYDYIFSGHTHRSMIRKYNGTTFVNPGSAGMPRDVGNQLSFAIVDFERDLVSIKKVESPIQEIRAAYGAMVHPAVLKLLERL